jgi:uncharacterized protein YdaU (DUF1376 family)
MAKVRDPSFPFYPADWLSSQSIATMTAEQERAFLRLLLHCWLSGTCSLNDDNDELAALSLLGDKWKGPDGDKVRRCFKLSRGKLVNEKLASLWKERQEHRKKSQEGGLKSGAARRSKSKGTSRLVRTKDEPNGKPSSSSSLSSSFASSRSILDACLARVRAETLAGPQPLLDWISEAVKLGAVDGSDHTRDCIAALAVRCRERGRNGGAALFTTLMRESKLNHASAADFEAALDEIRLHQRPANGEGSAFLADLLGDVGKPPKE